MTTTLTTDAMATTLTIGGKSYELSKGDCLSITRGDGSTCRVVVHHIPSATTITVRPERWLDRVWSNIVYYKDTIVWRVLGYWFGLWNK